MRRATFISILFFLTIIPLAALAANTINWTFYAPGAGGKIEGGFDAAFPDASGHDVLHTLDDVRSGASPYVTLASATSMKGKWFCIGTVTYASPIDRQMHTLTNVVGYVNDTGCAFNGTCSKTLLSQYSNGVARPDKMDIAVGNFTGWGALTASHFVDNNGNTAPKTWQEIAGLPTPSTNGSSNGTACNGIPKESGTAVAAQYQPTSVYAADITSPFANVSTLGQGNYYYQGTNAYSTPGLGSSVFSQPTYAQPTQTATVVPATTQATQTTQSTATVTTGTTQTTTTTVVNVQTGTPVAQIIVQPTTVTSGSSVILSWSSAGMSAASPCQVYQNKTTLVATANAATRIITLNSPGTTTFSLSCTVGSAAAAVQGSASVVVQ